MVAALLASLALSVTYQGDSLTVGSQPYLGAQDLPQTSFSAATGRHVDRGLEILPHQGLGRVVVFALGTNDYGEAPATLDRQLREVRRIVGNRCLVTETIYVRHPVDGLNRVLRRRSDQVVEWAHAVSSGRVHLVDGVHPGEAGYRLRARLTLAAERRCRSP